MLRWFGESDLIRMFESPYPRPRLQALLRRAVKNPAAAVYDSRCYRPGFCIPFFDLCDALSYETPERALELAEAAVRLGHRTGNRHLVNRSLGVRVNAEIALARWDSVPRILRQHELAVAGCCESCLADHLHRRADVDLEFRRTDAAMRHLEDARPGLAACGDVTGIGRTLNLRATGSYFGGYRGAAIAGVGETLRTMPLDSPELFFRDAIGLTAGFLRGAGRELDVHALESLLFFKQRLKGVVGWSKVRLRARWLEGLLHGRLGDKKRAGAMLERARQALMMELGIQRGRFVDAERQPAPEYTDRESRELIAITADVGLLVCHGGRESRAVRSMLDTCKRSLTLDQELRWTLEETQELVRNCPERASSYLVKLRAAVLVPIHDLLSDKLLGPERAAALRRRDKPPSATPLCFSAATSTG